MPLYATPATPIFDSNLTFLAINILEDELEEADCFGNVMYSEIQPDFTVKRCVLQHESLRGDWFKVLRSGEVLLSLFHMSDKIRSILEKCKCPLQPLLMGDGHSSWQRVRTRFLCNWQGFYSVIEYLQQHLSVRVDGLDPSGEVIVESVDLETARIIVMGALTQCFVLLGKQPPVGISGDCNRQQPLKLRHPAGQRANCGYHQSRPEPKTPQQPQTPHTQPPQKQPQQQPIHQQRQQQLLIGYSNNNSGNPFKTSTLQPKVNRLSNKKRVICIYDTTTSEGSDHSSIDATPIDHRNSATTETQMQSQPQQLPQLHETHQHLQPHRLLVDDAGQPAAPAVVPEEAGQSAATAGDMRNGILHQVLYRLDEIKTLLLNSGFGSACHDCHQRLLHSKSAVDLSNAVAAAAQATANASAAVIAAAEELDSSSYGTNDPQLASASEAASPQQQIQNTSAIHDAAASEPATLDAPVPVKQTSRRREVLCNGTSKRNAVMVTKLMATNQGIVAPASASHAIPTPTSNYSRADSARSSELNNSRSDAGQNNLAQSPLLPLPVTTAGKKSGKRSRIKVITRRRAVKSGKQLQQQLEQQQLIQLPQQSDNLEKGDPLLNSTASDERPVTAESEKRRQRVASGVHRNKLEGQQLQQHKRLQQPLQQTTGSGKKRHKAWQSDGVGSGATVAARGVASGANVNNDGGVKKITRSTVQDLINKLQAVLNQEA